MEIRFNGKEYFFGRKPKVPQRETSIMYYGGSGYTVNHLDVAFNKEMSATTLRKFAQMPVVRRAINITKNTLFNCPWSISKRDINNDVDFSNEINTLTRCLERPNNGDSFRSLMGATIEDILTGDCGAIEVCMSDDSNRPIWLYPVDGFTLEVCTKQVLNPKDIKYKQRKTNGGYVDLANEDIMYFNMNNYSYTPLGTSPVEQAFMIIQYLLNAQRYAGTVASNAIPKYLLNLGENADQNTISKFRKYFEEEIYGSGKTPIVGGSKGIATEQLSASDDNGLYLQWQHFLITIISYTFNIDPKRLNEGSQTDRSTVAEQKENILDEAIKPLAKVIEENINAKVLGRVNLDDVLVFKFHFEDNETRKKAKSDRILAEFNADILTLNEARQLLGYEKVSDKELEEYGDMLKSQYKTALNTKYAKETQDAGGYNGVGKDRYDGNKKEGD